MPDTRDLRKHLRDAAWYATYPVRDVPELVGTLGRVGEILNAGVSPTRALSPTDRTRMGAVVASTAAGAAGAYVGVRMGWGVDALWSFPAVWAAWYAETRESRRVHGYRSTCDGIAAHAQSQIKATDPTQVFVDEARFDRAGRVVAFDLCYPAEWPDSVRRNRDKLAEHVIGKLPGKGWQVVEWDTEHNYARFEVVVSTIPDRLLPEVHDGLPWYRIPIGRGAGGKVEAFDLRRTPHILVVAATGGGKTTCLRNMALQVAHTGKLDVVVLDPKFDLVSLRGRKGIRVITDPVEMEMTLGRYVERMTAAYAARDQGAAMEHLSTLLIVDELAQVVATVPHSERVRGYLDRLAMMARGARLHLAIGTQQPNVSDTLSGAARENVLGAVATAPMSPQGSGMAARGNTQAFRSDVEDGGYASDHPGRIAVMRGGSFAQVQAYWLEDPVEVNDDLPAKLARELRDRSSELFGPPDMSDDEDGLHLVG